MSNYRTSGTPHLARGEGGHIYAQGKMGVEPRLYDHINRCTSNECEFWSYMDWKAERHMRRKPGHVVTHQET